MSELLKLCNRYFQTKDFYEILNINRSANEKESTYSRQLTLNKTNSYIYVVLVKKAYHKLSLLVHPDRVDEDKKVEATEKFKVLGKIHCILSDSNKRAVYDESGEFDEENDSGFDWADYWRSLFKKITIEDIQNYERDYIGSEIELRDIKRAYVDGKGNMDYMFETVPFINCDSEPRICEIVREMIAREEVPEFKSFTEEPQRNKVRRRKKWERDQAKASTVEYSELAKAMEENTNRRAKKMQDFFSELEAKYGGKNQKKKRKSLQNGESPPSKRTRASRKKN